MIQITLTKIAAEQILEFITEHLEVVNDTPHVEQLMIDLEQAIEEQE